MGPDALILHISAPEGCRNTMQIAEITTLLIAVSYCRHLRQN